MKKLEEGQYELKACLQVSGNWRKIYDYKQKNIKEVFLITDKPYLDNSNGNGYHIFLMTNHVGNKSIWSGNLLENTEKIETRLTF